MGQGIEALCGVKQNGGPDALAQRIVQDQNPRHRGEWMPKLVPRMDPRAVTRFSAVACLKPIENFGACQERFQSFGNRTPYQVIRRKTGDSLGGLVPDGELAVFSEDCYTFWNAVHCCFEKVCAIRHPGPSKYSIGSARIYFIFEDAGRVEGEMLI